MSKSLFSLPEGCHGKGVSQFCWQKSQGNYLATTGLDCVVRIWDRHGTKVDEIRLPGACSGLGWDKDGDILAVANDQTSMVFLWNANSQRLNQIDIGLKEQISCLIWSKATALLALGSAKGTLLLYSHHSQKKLPIIGKHGRKIVQGAWSNQNLLALTSEDRVLTISNADGDTVHQAQLRGDPSDIQFAELKLEGQRSQGDNCVTMVVSKKTLYFFKLSDAQNPLELAFQPHYGNLMAYKWFGDGYIVMGFSLGYFVVISTHPMEIGQELFQTKAHHDNLASVATSQVVNLCATAGDNCVKIHSLLDLRDTVSVITLEEETYGLNRVGWSDDGQLLAIASNRGSVHVFLARLPMLHAAWQTRVAYLTSLREVTVEDQVIKSNLPLTADVDLEPAFLGLGPYHVAIGMNNIAYFYLITESGLEKRRPYEYLGTVQDLKLSTEYAAALLDGRIQLHSIEQMLSSKSTPEEENRESRLFPDKQQRDSRITCFDMTSDLLVFGTDRGAIHYFMLDAWTTVSKWHHVNGLSQVYVNSTSGLAVFVDERGEGFLYNPLNDRLLELPQFSSKTRAILWETSATNNQVFVSFDDELIFTYVLHSESVRGPHCQIAGRTKLPHGFVPILLYNGDITLQVQNGKVKTTRLGTHLKDDEFKESDLTKLLKSFEKALSLLRFNEAWIICERMNIHEHWVTLGRAAMEEMEVAFAIRVFRHLGDAGMVWSLEEILDIDDRSLKSGYLAMFLEQFDLAQQLFLSSSKPVAALDMQRDLLNWEQALQLAKALSPDQLPFISKEYAQQLEFIGDYANALAHFERSVTKNPDYREHDEVCAAGIARTSIRTGDMRRGIVLATKLPNRQVKKDSAAILESLKQWNEAGQLYETASYYDEAASAFIRAKNWSKVRELLDYVTSTRIYKDYAKAKEADEQFVEAAKAYEKAKEWQKAVQINLEKLQNAQEAVRIVQQSGSTEGALLVARFFEKLSDYASAIQFLVMSQCNDEGFKLAQKQHHMDVYAAAVADKGSQSDYQSIAVYYENDRNYLLAGKFYRRSQDYEKALKHLLKAHDIAGSMPSSEDALELAIEATGEANDQNLTKMLTDYLMGETDGMPKDPKYLFQLYMSLKRFPEAAKSAVIIAREEQRAGNYRVAHDVLVSMCRELKGHDIRVPYEMSTSLQVLHSYLLARIYTKMNDHTRAARLLKRVATNYISRFPAHTVQILISAVIECQRAGLKESSFSLAATLLRPEYRDQIDAKYKKKIEGIVRKPEQGEEQEAESACPNCGLMVPEMDLVCQHCKNALPYCIASGRHVTRDDFSVCPNCDFPTLLTDFLKIVAENDSRACPMCSESVNTDGMRVLDEEVAAKYLSSLQNDET